MRRRPAHWKEEFDRAVAPNVTFRDRPKLPLTDADLIRAWNGISDAGARERLLDLEQHEAWYGITPPGSSSVRRIARLRGIIA